MSIRHLSARVLAACLLAAAPLALAPAALAQEAPAAADAAAPTFTESHIAAARATIAALDASSQFDVILPNIATQVSGLFARSFPDQVAVVDEVVNAAALELVGRRAELERALEQIWASQFTEQELNEITTFYSTATGMKFGSLMGGIVSLSAQTADAWGQALGQDLLELARTRLQERGLTLPQ